MRSTANGTPALLTLGDVQNVVIVPALALEAVSFPFNSKFSADISCKNNCLILLSCSIGLLKAETLFLPDDYTVRSVDSCFCSFLFSCSCAAVLLSFFLQETGHSQALI